MRPWAAFAGCLCLAAHLLPAATTMENSWRRPGGVLAQGELSAVFGSVALISQGSQDFFVSLADLDDSETGQVAAYLAAKPPERPTWGTSTAAITKALKYKLQIFRDGELKSYDPTAEPEPEIFLIYFSAHWCPPCQAFTPELVQAYNQLQQVIPKKFEVIYVSNDHDRDEQWRYAREAHMPWPVVEYSECGHIAPVDRWAGDGIPCLVALTPEGKVIFHTYNNGVYLGPEQVLTSFENLVPMIQGGSPEIRRARFRLNSIRRLAATGHGSCPPQPYLVSLDPRRYQTIEVDRFMLTLAVDPTGRVTDVSSEPPLSYILQDQLRHDVGNWLFLPAIKAGIPAAETLHLPIEFKRAKANLTTQAEPKLLH